MFRSATIDILISGIRFDSEITQWRNMVLPSTKVTVPISRGMSVSMSVVYPVAIDRLVVFLSTIRMASVVKIA